jgi:HPr kinase/phosphorylase
VVARCPATIKGLIEARGIGFLRPKLVQETRLHLVIDLNQHETSRLPEQKYHDLFKVKLPLIYPTQMDGFASAVYVLAQSGLAQDQNPSDVIS